MSASPSSLIRFGRGTVYHLTPLHVEIWFRNLEAMKGWRLRELFKHRIPVQVLSESIGIGTELTDAFGFSAWADSKPLVILVERRTGRVLNGPMRAETMTWRQLLRQWRRRSGA